MFLRVECWFFHVASTLAEERKTEIAMKALVIHEYLHFFLFLRSKKPLGSVFLGGLIMRDRKMAVSEEILSDF